jgi:hypothetical protein
MLLPYIMGLLLDQFITYPLIQKSWYSIRKMEIKLEDGIDYTS